MSICMRSDFVSDYRPQDVPKCRDETTVVVSIGHCAGVSAVEEMPRDDFIEQASNEVVALYKTAEKCNTALSAEIAKLNLQNGELGSQLEASTGRESELRAVHAAETQTLKDQNAFLQQQLNQLREENRLEAVRLQGLLAAAQQEKTAALAAQQAASDQQKILLQQQISALQNQVSTKENQLASKDRELTAKTSQLTAKEDVLKSKNAEIESLKSHAAGELARQENYCFSKRVRIYWDISNVIYENMKALRNDGRSYTNGKMSFVKPRAFTALDAYKWMRDHIILARLTPENHLGNEYSHAD